MKGDPTLNAPRVLGQPEATALSRVSDDDFKVEEITAVRPSGSGEHLLVKVRKRGANTQWVARSLASRAGVGIRDIGFAGLKDRHAVTEQWFSIHVPGRDVTSDALAGDDYEILERVRHTRKIRRGALRGNRFEIILRNVEGNRRTLEERLCCLGSRGAPNYFGSQRFGRDGSNLAPPGTKRRLSGIRLSAYRSFLFNAVLSRRVEDGTWERALPGDCLLLDGTQRFFTVEAVDEELTERARRLDVHPTGAMWGRGEPASGMAVADMERGVAAEWQGFSAVLESQGLRQDRRALRMRVLDLDWRWADSRSLVLMFTLPRGSYATALLREMVVLRSAPQSEP